MPCEFVSGESESVPKARPGEAGGRTRRAGRTAEAQTWPRSELTQRSGRRVITTCSPWFSQAKST